ncbi:MAG: hypothetical protein Q7W45_02115 [Bacteroidota bacterium]|nr:hypothetical protein [Bacteroidota bacterium]MDP3143838.1 hypothetical protein [Bacteroidota bacterium]
MRTLISIFLILTTTLLISQTKSSDAKVIVEVDPVYNKVTVKLITNSDSLINCKVQIMDSKNNLVKTVDLPKATKQIESSIVILGLGLGHYTYFVYQGKEELYKGKFYIDAILLEPQTQPVVRKSQN